MLLEKNGNFTLERGEGGLTITYQPSGAAIQLPESGLYELSEAILAWLELIEFQAGQNDTTQKV